MRHLLLEPLEDRLLPSTVWADRFDDMDGRINGGDGFSHKTDSADLAWGESYVLQGYLAMYRATGSTAYLDKFVEQSNTVLASATDQDGDGHLGWGSYRYSVSLARTPGFELLGSDPTLPRDWYRVNATASTARLDTAQHVDGKYGVTVKADYRRGWQTLESVAWNPNVRDNHRYEPGVSYRLEFDGKTIGSAGGRVQVYDFTARRQLGAALLTYNSGWRHYQVTFRMPATAGHDVRIRLTNTRWDYSGIAHFDNVTLKQYAEYAVHAGQIGSPLAQFAAAVRADPALAGYRDEADAYLAFIREELLPRWEADYRADGASGGVYLAPDDGSLSIAGQALPHNQYLGLGRVYLWLYAADGRVADRSRAEALGTTFRRFLVLDGGAYLWRYHDPVLGGPVLTAKWEDVDHANTDVNFVADAWSLGLVFNDTDITRFTETFLSRLWNGSSSSPAVAFRVDGSGEMTDGLWMFGFAKLVGRDPDLWDALNAITSRNAAWGATPGPASASGLMTIALLAEFEP